MNQRIFAFWKSDRFPYLLGGEVGSFTKHGFVVSQSSSYTFRPIIIVPYDDGIVLMNELHILEQEMNNELNDMKGRYNSKLDDLLLHHLPEGVKLHV